MSRPVIYKFRLYVADDALNSAQARTNLAEMCKTHLAGRCEVEVVDVFKQPQRALSDAIYLTPTLVRTWPLPVRCIVGTLTQTAMVLRVLDLEGDFAAGPPQGEIPPPWGAATRKAAERGGDLTAGPPQGEMR